MSVILDKPPKENFQFEERPVSAFKWKVYELIKEGKKSSFSGNLFNFSIITLIILNVVAIVLESFHEFNETYSNHFDLFESFSILIFTTEYILRIYTADLNYHLPTRKARLKFILSPIGIIDLLAILPFFLPFILTLDLRVIRLLRIMRVIRIFKLNRYSKSLRLMGNVFWERKEDLFLTFFLTLIALIISSTLMFYQEGKLQPEFFPNILATFWWGIATITTVGYGDVYPITSLGKVLSGFIALSGIILFALPAGMLASSFLNKMKEENPKKKKKKKEKKYCPHCGEKIL
jgi:voltage-gated potassium channel